MMRVSGNPVKADIEKLEKILKHGDEASSYAALFEYTDRERREMAKESELIGRYISNRITYKEAQSKMMEFFKSGNLPAALTIARIYGLLTDLPSKYASLVDRKKCENYRQGSCYGSDCELCVRMTARLLMSGVETIHAKDILHATSR